LARYAEAGSAPATGAQIVTQSALINLLNPKLTLFFVSFLPQFVPQTHPAPMLTMGLMGLVLVAQAFVVFLDYGELAARGGDLLRRRPRIMVPFQTGIAVLFAGLGLRVILGGR
jgi:threonine/homoserine/homoserine lactone efflux protein